MELPVRNIIIPLNDPLVKDFCYYMKYELIKEIDGVTYFKIPHSHLCKLYINAANWKTGNFERHTYG